MLNSRVCALNDYMIPPFGRADLGRKIKSLLMSSCLSFLRSQYVAHDVNTPLQRHSASSSCATSIVFTGQNFPTWVNQLCAFSALVPEALDIAGDLHRPLGIALTTKSWHCGPQTLHSHHRLCFSSSFLTLSPRCPLQLLSAQVLPRVSHPAHSVDNPGPYFIKRIQALGCHILILQTPILASFIPKFVKNTSFLPVEVNPSLFLCSGFNLLRDPFTDHSDALPPFGFSGLSCTCPEFKGTQCWVIHAPSLLTAALAELASSIGEQCPVYFDKLESPTFQFFWVKCNF